MPVALHQNYQQRNAKAIAAHACGARFLCIVTGRRGGKTTLSVEEFLERIFADLEATHHIPYLPGAVRPGTAEWWRRKPRLHYWVVAHTYDLLAEFKRILFAALPPELCEHVDNSQNTLWIWPDILIDFKSGVHHEKLRSAGLNGLLMDEGQLMHDDAWQGTIRPLLSDKNGWAIVTATPNGRNWLHRDLVAPAQKGEPGYAFHTWHTVDNTNVPGLVAEVEMAKRTMAPEFFRREYEASFDAFTGQVFKGWDRGKHVLKEIPNDFKPLRILGGADWGWSNPGCLGVTMFGQLCSVRVAEVYESSELVEDFWAPKAVELMQKWNFRHWIADPESPADIRRFQKAGRTAGLRITGHRNVGSGRYDEHMRNIMFGIKLMASRIHQNRLFSLADCPAFANEMEEYVWEKHSKAGYVERPAMHQRDHTIDTERYTQTTFAQPATLQAVA